MFEYIEVFYIWIGEHILLHSSNPKMLEQLQNGT